MKHLNLVILILVFGVVGCENQSKSNTISSVTSEERIIENLVRSNIDSCIVISSNNTLLVEIFSPPSELMILERNNLTADSILLLAGNKLWHYDSVDFHFMADTTDKKDLKYFEECKSLRNKAKSLLTSIVKRSMNQQNLISKAEKFNSKTYMKFFRLILNQLTTQELNDYQSTMDFMNSRFPDKFTDNFITTVLDLGFKWDQGLDCSKEKTTIQKLSEISELMTELDIYLNTKILEEIMTTTNNG